MLTDIQKAKELLESSGASCVAVKGGAVAQSGQPGVMALLHWLETEPEVLRGASAADKVVGKAAALLMTLGGVREVYAEIISDSARTYFEQNGVPYSYGEKVETILNRDKTGTCPMERRCLAIDSPQEAYEVLREMVSRRAQA